MMIEIPGTPDTKAAVEARDLAQNSLGPALFNHSMRSYLLAATYGRKQRRDYDAEGLFIAAMFHDLGMTDKHRDRSRAFPEVSSQLLREFLTVHSFPGNRIERASDAIELHMRLFPAWSSGNEVGLLQIGAWMDVVYLRRWSLWKQARQIAKQYPRDWLDLRFPAYLLRTLGSVRSCTGLWYPRQDRTGTE